MTAGPRGTRMTDVRGSRAGVSSKGSIREQSP